MKKYATLFCLLVLSICLLNSCQDSSNENPSLYSNFDNIQKEWSIDTSQVIQLAVPEIAEQEFLLSTYADSSWSVPLETNAESMIGAIDKIKIHNDILYILDIRKTKLVLAFDLNGKFLFKIGQHGQEAGKYVQPDDFCVNQKTGEIVIYDDQQRKLLYYGLDGRFLQENKMGFLLFGIDYLNNGEFALNSFGRSDPTIQDTPHRLLQMNAKGQVIRKGIPYQKKEEILALRTSMIEFTHFQNELVYSPNLLGNIYSVTPEGIRLKYQLDFGEHALPEEYVQMDMMEFMAVYNAKVEENKYGFFTGPFFETKEQLVFNLVKGGKFYTGISPKYKNTFSYGIFKDDLPGSVESDRFFTTYQDQYLVGSRDSYYFVKDKALHSQSKSKEVVEMLDQLAPTDNPVVSFYRLKSNSPLLSSSQN